MTKRQKILLITYWGLILLGLIFLSCGCVTSKRTKPCNQCPQYSMTSIPIIDTFTIYTPHYNYNNICYPTKKIRCVTYDTIYIDSL